MLEPSQKPQQEPLIGLKPPTPPRSRAAASGSELAFKEQLNELGMHVVFAANRDGVAERKGCLMQRLSDCPASSGDRRGGTFVKTRQNHRGGLPSAEILGGKRLPCRRRPKIAVHVG